MLHEVLALDIKVAREGDFSRAGGGVVGVIFYLELFALALGVVHEGELEGAQDGHGALGVLVEVLSEAVLQQRVIQMCIRDR